MLRPEHMTKLDIQVSEEYISQVTMVIARLKGLHLLNVRKVPLGQDGMEYGQEGLFINKYKQLYLSLQNLYKALSLPFVTPCCPVLKDFDPFRDIVTFEKELQEREENCNEILGKIKLKRESNRDKQELLRLMELIFNLGSPSSLRMIL